ncbi:alpha/beta hydrolase-fold protein [Agromyces sp. MMS24-JH15]|uniref:alpha/beta hydrolase-fold protein n=1 Tax=Agromyces sp. MMS24-JH15 TaxID=3243765 RepID=UPI00374A1981
MWESLLEIDIVADSFVLVWLVLSGILVLYLLAKEWSIRWFLVAFLVLFVSALIGGGVVWIAVNVLNAFGGPVDDAVWLWVPLAFAGIGLAIFNLWGSRWWRKVVAGVSIVVFALTALFAINAAYGLNRTLGSLLHISTADPITPITPPASAPPEPEGALYTWWTPPADLPATGRSGVVDGGIPNAVSGFPARPAQLYLPPAALVAAPPRLPLMIFMMGQPGDPDVSFTAEVLDRFAADHGGLAPIVLVVDQLGDPSVDPLCLDTSMGKVETYVMQDVVPWATANLHVDPPGRFWTVGGYSNGGQCALYFGSKYPETFANILDISGEEFQGADNADAVLASVFDGDEFAYDAVKPTTIMTAKTPYPDTWVVFTVGSEDPHYPPGVERNAEAATQAGMHVTSTTVEGAGHGADALTGGLQAGFDVLYPRLELAPPPAE